MINLSHKNRGFTLVELMVVLGIVGILAGIAIPQYRTYTVRSEASQALSAIRPIQMGIATYAQTNLRLPPNSAAIPAFQFNANTVVRDTCNGIVQRVDYINPANTTATTTTVRVTFWTDNTTITPTSCQYVSSATTTTGLATTSSVPQPLSGRTLDIRATHNGNGVVNWSLVAPTSTTAQVQSEYQPPLGR